MIRWDANGYAEGWQTMHSIGDFTSFVVVSASYAKAKARSGELLLQDKHASLSFVLAGWHSRQQRELFDPPPLARWVSLTAADNANWLMDWLEDINNEAPGRLETWARERSLIP